MRSQRWERGKGKNGAQLARQSVKGLLALPLVAAGSWILYSHLVIDHHIHLPEAVPGDRHVFASKAAGGMSYYTGPSVEGRPLVLIHSINAAASAYEMRPLFLHYAGKRPVYALDLPGYGFSERSKRKYTPNLYVNAILDFLNTIVGQSADVVALSLSCEFAAQAANQRPDLFSSLVMISPSGFSAGGREQTAQQPGPGRLLYSLFTIPVWARPLFDLLTSRKSIAYYLKQSFIGQPPADLIDYSFITSHQPGAEHVPLTFICGLLFNRAIRTQVYERLQVPTMVLYDRDAYVNFGMLNLALARNENLRAVRLIPSLGLPSLNIWKIQPEYSINLGDAIKRFP